MFTFEIGKRLVAAMPRVNIDHHNSGCGAGRDPDVVQAAHAPPAVDRTALGGSVITPAGLYCVFSRCSTFRAAPARALPRSGVVPNYSSARKDAQTAGGITLGALAIRALAHGFTSASARRTGHR